MTEQVNVVSGDRVLVTQLVGGDITEPAEYEVFGDGPDRFGDIKVKNGGEGFLWARGWTKKEPANAIQWNPITNEGDTVWVYEYYGTRPIEGAYAVRISQGIIDAEGDLFLQADTSALGLYAKRWRLPDDVEPPAEPDWNPRVLAGDDVWVYEYYAGGVVTTEQGYDVRTSMGHIDADGDMSLQSLVGTPYLYAKRWRKAGNPAPEPTPEPATLNPEVKAGDRVKVLGVLSGAHDAYRQAVMGQVVTVVTGTLGHQNELTVHLPNGYRMDGNPTGAIAQWELADENPVTTGNSEPAPEVHVHGDDPTDYPNWGDIIANWRDKLNEYACDQSWCEEYENTVRNLFGWEPERRAEVTVNVRLTKQAWFSDVVRLESIFGADEDYMEVVDEHYEFQVDVTVNVMADVGGSPDEFDVKEALENDDYNWDSFQITNWQNAGE